MYWTVVLIVLMAEINLGPSSGLNVVDGGEMEL